MHYITFHYDVEVENIFVIKTINEINKIFKESPNKLFVNNDNELGCFYIDDDKKKEKGEYHLTDIDNIRWIS